LLAWRRTSLVSLWRNLCVPAICAAICALILPLAGITDVGVNIGFSVSIFTAAAILYELWRGTRVRHRHGEAYPLALYMLFKRYRQRYGGYVVHLGLVMLAVGVIGSHAFQTQHDITLKAGQETTIDGYRFVYSGNLETTLPDKTTVISQLRIWHAGRLQGYIYPGRTIYTNFSNQPASQISITTFGLTDVYVFLADWTAASQATLQIFINPLVPLVWYGGLLMILGGILCWWPVRVLNSKLASVTQKTKLQPAGGLPDGEVVV
jgi:cytochrome c-type biogenesis protein CcmF